MTTYVALLRAINLGARNRVPMAGLRALCTEIGATDVRTYIASGNVVLRWAASRSALSAALEDGIEREFGLRTPVVVLTASALRAVVERNPFVDATQETIYVAFAAGELSTADRARLNSLDFPPERLAAADRHIYLHSPNGFAGAQLPRAIDRVSVPLTVRTWRTVTALHGMAGADHR